MGYQTDAEWWQCCCHMLMINFMWHVISCFCTIRYSIDQLLCSITLHVSLVLPTGVGHNTRLTSIHQRELWSYSWSRSPELRHWSKFKHYDKNLPSVDYVMPNLIIQRMLQIKRQLSSHSIRRHYAPYRMVMSRASAFELHQPWYTGELLLLLKAQLPSERTLMASEWWCPLPTVFFLASWTWLW